MDYFDKLYCDDNPHMVLSDLVTGGFPCLAPVELQMLSETVTEAEVLRAIKQMNAFKAPGVDGFQAVFFQRCWDVVGPSTMEFVRSFFRTGRLPKRSE